MTTPVLVSTTVGGLPRTELVVNGTGSDNPAGGWVIAYDPNTGRELWRLQGTTDSVWPTAIVGGGLVISTSGRDGPTLAIRPGGQGNVTATHLLWKHRRGAPYVPTGVAYHDRLYLVNDRGVMTCADLATGASLWRSRLDGKFSASLVAGDGKVYAASESGTVYVVQAGESFELLAANELNERIVATPALAGGDLFLRTQSALVCISGNPVALADGRAHEPGAANPSIEDEDAVASPSDLLLEEGDAELNQPVETTGAPQPDLPATP